MSTLTPAHGPSSGGRDASVRRGRRWGGGAARRLAQADARRARRGGRGADGGGSRGRLAGVGAQREVQRRRYRQHERGGPGDQGDPRAPVPGRWRWRGRGRLFDRGRVRHRAYLRSTGGPEGRAARTGWRMRVRIPFTDRAGSRRASQAICPLRCQPPRTPVGPNVRDPSGRFATRHDGPDGVAGGDGALSGRRLRAQDGVPHSRLRVHRVSAAGGRASRCVSYAAAKPAACGPPHTVAPAAVAADAALAASIVRRSTGTETRPATRHV